MRIVKQGKPPKPMEYHVCEELPPAKNYYEGTIIQADCGHYYIVDSDDSWGIEEYWEKLFWRNLWQQIFGGGFKGLLNE